MACDAKAALKLCHLPPQWARLIAFRRIFNVIDGVPARDFIRDPVRAIEEGEA
jgi:hypothetical protein